MLAHLAINNVSRENAQKTRTPKISKLFQGGVVKTKLLMFVRFGVNKDVTSL
jgi:hypothetical protein